MAAEARWRAQRLDDQTFLATQSKLLARFWARRWRVMSDDVARAIRVPGPSAGA